MYTKKSALAVAAALGVGLGSAGTAAANVYAGSGLNINDLFIQVTPQETADSFNFTTTNTATLNGVADIDSDSCGGVPTGIGANSCGTGGSPALNSLPANAPGGDVNRADNTFTFFGPGATNEFANSDSVIDTSQLTHPGSTTDTNQIAEAQLQTGQSASANAEIQSTTGFEFTFTIDNPGSLLLTFNADPDLFAAINEANPGTFSTQANINSSFSLRQQNGGGAGEVNWNPQGTAANDCTASGGPSCAETADTQDLNANIGTSANGTTDELSWDPMAANLTAFGFEVTDLTAGTWTLTLNAVTSVSANRQVAVPEPGTLLLLGSGLAAVGFASRRKKKA